MSKSKKSTSAKPRASRNQNALSARPETASAGSIPMRLLNAAIKAVPSLKYALGVLGIVSAIAIIKTLGIDFRAAAFGTVVMLVLMVAIVVFAALTGTKSPHMRLAALVMLWSFLILTISSAALLFTSVFFDFPRPITSILGVVERSMAPVQQQGPANGQTGQADEATEDPLLNEKPPWLFTLEPLDPKTVSPDRPLVVTINAAEVKKAAALGKIPAADLERLESVVPDLAARGPLGDLKRAINHIGASMNDIYLRAYANKQPGARTTLESLRQTTSQKVEILGKLVDEFALILQRSPCVNYLIPPTGQTKEQYVMHLQGLADEAVAIGRRYVLWESGNATDGTGYAPAGVYLTKEECKIENILAADCRVRRALWDELRYLKRLETTVLARPSSEN